MTEVALSEPQRAEVSGVPTFWGEAPGLYTGALMFRVGQADETLPRSGISHLVEHLAMFPIDRQAYAYGAYVDDTRTVFYARGEPHEVAEFLEATARNLTALPLDRLEKERRVLHAELANHPGAHPLWRLRFGPSGFGLTAYEELGLHWLPPEEIEAWAADRFTRSNAAMWFSSDPPGGLDLELPAGRRIPPPVAVTLADVELPAFSCLDGQTGIGVSLLGERSAALNAGSRLLAERIQDHLRRDLGLSYSVADSYWRLNADQAHLVMLADATPGHAQSVHDAFFGVLDDLTANGPSEASLERHALLTERNLREPQYQHTLLSDAASNELAGSGQQPLESLISATKELTAPDISEALAAVMPGMIMSLPQGIRADSTRATEYAADWEPQPLDPRDCVAAIIEGDHGLALMNNRGEVVELEFESAAEREETTRRVLAEVPAERIARVEVDPPERAERVHALAEAELGRTGNPTGNNALARFFMRALERSMSRRSLRGAERQSWKPS